MGKSNYDEIATMPIVASLLNIQGKRKNSTSMKYPCPKCGHKAFEANEIKGKCFKCDFKGNYISFYAEATGCSTKDAVKRIIEGTGGTFNFVSHEEPEEPMANIEKRNKVYSKLLSFLGLSKKHVADLKQRGLTESQIKKLGYRSYLLQSRQSRIEVTKKLKGIGLNIKGVPGFFLNEDGYDILCWRKTGILVPYRDCHNQIQGFQIRKDEDKLEIDEDGKKENKYDWIGSKGKKRGCGAKGFVHFACDFYLDFTTQQIRPILGSKVILTEGAMKADICHALSGLPVIAVPGTKNLKELPDVLDFLKDNHVKVILNAFDMDYLSNPNVKKDSKKLTALIKKHGLITSRLLWDRNYKGIDDLFKHYVDIKKTYHIKLGIKYSRLTTDDKLDYAYKVIKKTLKTARFSK